MAEEQPALLALEPTGDVRALYQLHDRAIEVVVATADAHAEHRTVRVTAKQRLPDGDFCAAYEERVEVTTSDGAWTLWVEAAFPWADGASVEECLRRALAFVASARVEDG